VPDDDGSRPERSVIAHVAPGSHDLVTLSTGDREVVVTNRALVRAILNGIR
jgi:hypothetical protein